MSEPADISLEIHSLIKRVRRYLSLTMPQNARVATGGNAYIIMFLAHHTNRDIVQRDIEERFSISPSTASRVLALMEKKGLIERRAVADDARVKKIVLTDMANDIVLDLARNAQNMRDKLFAGFTDRELEDLTGYIHRLQANIGAAITEAEQEHAGMTYISNGEEHW